MHEHNGLAAKTKRPQEVVARLPIRACVAIELERFSVACSTFEADLSIRARGRAGSLRNMQKITALLFVSLLALTPEALAVDRNAGPWELGPLSEVPDCQVLDEEILETEVLVQSITYAGQPYRGKPTRVFAYYARPGRYEGKLPAMVLVHGGGGTAFREWAELWARRGYAAIAMDLAGRGADKKRLDDGGPDQSYTEKFFDIANGVKDTWPYNTVANVVRATSLVRSFPEVDADRVGITGISWGGYLTCIVAGIDDRLKVAVPVYGCGFLHENSVWLKTFSQLPAADRELWIKNFDPSKYLAGCRMPAMFVTGTNDFAYPLDSYQKSYRLVSGPTKLCVTVDMPHGHPQGWAPKEIGLFVDSVLKNGTSLPKISGTVRSDKQISVEVKSPLSLSKAELHCTTDTGVWEDRTWKTFPAQLDQITVKATLPTSHGITYFITVADERGAIVSSEHEVIPREVK